MALFSRDDSVPLQALLKRFALIYLPCVLVVTIVFLSSVRFDEQDRLENTRIHEKSRIDIAKVLIAQDLKAVDSELRIVANLPVLRWYLDTGNPAQRDELAKLLRVLVREARRYDHVRYLDASGQEAIRINFNDGEPVIVPREQLQDKSGRYYFRDTLKLNRGEIYVSPLDLNIEQDQLEVPHKPMIRFGTPVFDSAGRKKGVVVFNYLGDALRKDFREVMRGTEHRAMLINHDGYWLSSPNPDDEWGLVRGRNDRTFGRDFPEEWHTISDGDEGMLLTSKGLFVYATVSPLLPGQHSSTGSALPSASSNQELRTPEYDWKIVSFVPHDVLSRAALYNQTGGKTLFVFIYLLLALVAWIIALTTLSRKHVWDELSKSKARYDELVRTIPVGVYLLRIHADGLMRFEYVSPVFCQMLGLDAEAVLRDASVAFAAAYPDDRESLLRSTQDIAVSLKPYRWEGRYIVRGQTRWIRISSEPTLLPGDGSLWSGAVSDITERKQIEESLHRSVEEIEDLYDHAPCGYHSLDKDGLIVRINQTELDWLGYSREELVGKVHITDLFTPASVKVFQENFPAFKERGYVHDLEFEFVRKDGTLLPIVLNATAVRDADGQFVMSRSTMFDMTERKKLEQELKRQARTDVLTGLNNRRNFFELAEHELSRAQRHDEPLSALMLDVDHFKLINDTHGHHVGDLVLQKLSEVCIGTLREIDLPGRIGGEEFAILLPETDGKKALEVAERLRLSIAHAAVPLDLGGAVSFSVSIGVASLVEMDASVDDILKRADTALYAAKNAGRNRVCDEATC